MSVGEPAGFPPVPLGGLSSPLPPREYCWLASGVPFFFYGAAPFGALVSPRRLASLRCPVFFRVDYGEVLLFLYLLLGGFMYSLSLLGPPRGLNWITSDFPLPIRLSCSLSQIDVQPD